MRLLLALTLALAACGYDTLEADRQLHQDAYAYWDDLWDILDEQWGVGDSECRYAWDATTILTTTQEQLSYIGCGNDVGGCTISNFPPGVPLGAYTIGLRENLGRGVLCHILLEEALHVADRCLGRNEASWPFPGGGHPDALFDWVDHDSVISRLDEAAWERCRNG